MKRKKSKWTKWKKRSNKCGGGDGHDSIARILRIAFWIRPFKIPQFTIRMKCNRQNEMSRNAPMMFSFLFSFRISHFIFSWPGTGVHVRLYVAHSLRLWRSNTLHRFSPQSAWLKFNLICSPICRLIFSCDRFARTFSFSFCATFTKQTMVESQSIRSIRIIRIVVTRPISRTQDTATIEWTWETCGFSSFDGKTSKRNNEKRQEKQRKERTTKKTCKKIRCDFLVDRKMWLKNLTLNKHTPADRQASTNRTQPINDLWIVWIVKCDTKKKASNDELGTTKAAKNLWIVAREKRRGELHKKVCDQ